jgi:hypothetical protein
MRAMNCDCGEHLEAPNDELPYGGRAYRLCVWL